MILTPKSGDLIEIPFVDGEVIISLEPTSPIENLVFSWPKEPFRASKVHIQSKQPITNIANLNATLDVPFLSLNADSDIRFVFCPISKTWLCTGKNEKILIGAEQLETSEKQPDVLKDSSEPKKRWYDVFGTLLR